MTKAQTGQWAPQHSPVNFFMVHLALLPGGTSYHSRIVVWDSQDIHAGAEFGWNSGAAGCDDWPYNLSRLDTLWNPPVKIVFAGHAQLANSRSLLTVGGWEDLTHGGGIPDALKLTPGSGASPSTWSARADMHQSRQSPTLTQLRDGRMLVTGGLRAAHEWYFGGRVNGNPPAGGTGDSLSRFGSGIKRVWDPLVKPMVLNSSDRPTPREGHTSARLLDPGPSQAFFGGKDGSGLTTDNDVYLLRRENGGPLDADYTYRWSKLQVGGSFFPPARSDHIALDLDSDASGRGQMAIYGGLRHPTVDTTTVLRDFWKLSYDVINLQWRWSPLDTSGSPGPRYGHAAVRNGNQMYLFGGSGSAGADPTDTQVYAFNLSTSQWRVLPTAAGPAPKPRRDHALVTVVGSSFSVLMYSGYLSASASSDTLWKLVPGDSAKWSVIVTQGTSPGPRANHSAFEGIGTGRLTIFGGDSTMSSDPAVDTHAYSIHPFPSTGSPTWVQEAEAPYRLTGHTVVSDPSLEPFHARIPEIYNPVGDTWTPQTGSGWMPPSILPLDIIRTYPVQFLVPGSSIPGGGGRLLRVGQDPKTRYVDLPATGLAGSWNDVASNVISGDTLHPVTGVQYLPGKILVAGNGPEDDDPIPDDRARTFDATAIGTATWVDADPQNMLVPRANVNMLVLPNGKVMILGGSGPQIWDPSSGSWTDLLALENERGYQSTAMVLPDGRVLTAGGFASGGAYMRVFCPPYLFSGDDLADRPSITSAPDSVVYGEAFEITTPAGDIASVCLIRPAAVTHGFDQNGRYVPLVFEALPDSGLRARIPVDGSIAPPGDYMLFILNAQGVPSIAKWIHVGDCAQIPCDAGSPPMVTDMYADVVTGNEIWMVWYAPGDDTSPLSGSYDLRISNAGLASEQAYATATPLSGEPAVQSQGTPVNFTVDSLSTCTQYHFALKTRDGTSPSFRNWSLLSNTVTVATTCGGPSGGSRAVRVDEGRVASGASATVVATSMEGEAPGESGPSSAGGPSSGFAALSSLEARSGVLEAETRRTQEGGWQVTLRRLSEAQGVEAADRDAIVSQVRDAAGGWRSLGRYRPAAGPYPLGLCALRDNGRVVLPAGYVVDHVAPGLRSRGQECAMSRADHSRSGAMSGSFLADGGAVEMQVGDVLTVTYDPAGSRPSDEISAYLQVRSSGHAAAPASATHRRPGAPLPTSFALHQNHPNPFDGSTTIGFDMPVAGAVRLELFDLLGRRVATLAEGEYPPGSHAVVWDLRGAGGAPVRAGVYMYRLQTGTFSARRKLSVLP